MAFRLRDVVGVETEKLMVAVRTGVFALGADGSRRPVLPGEEATVLAALASKRRGARAGDLNGPEAAILREAARLTNHVPVGPTPERERRGAFTLDKGIDAQGRQVLVTRDLEATAIKRLAAMGRLDREQVAAAERYVRDWRACGYEGAAGGTRFAERVDGGGNTRLSDNQVASREKVRRAQACVAAVYPGIVETLDRVVVYAETLEAAGLAEGTYQSTLRADSRALTFLQVGLLALAKHYGIVDGAACACAVERRDAAA